MQPMKVGSIHLIVVMISSMWSLGRIVRKPSNSPHGNVWSVGVVAAAAFSTAPTRPCFNQHTQTRSLFRLFQSTQSSSSGSSTSSSTSTTETTASGPDTVEYLKGIFASFRKEAVHMAIQTLSVEEKKELLGLSEISTATSVTSPTTTMTTSSNGVTMEAPNRLNGNQTSSPIGLNNDLENINITHSPETFRDEEVNVRDSIAEAVAKARAEETILQEEKWKKEKATLLSEVERATQERVDRELAAQKHHMEQYQQWSAAVEQAKQQQEQGTGASTMANNNNNNNNNLEISITATAAAVVREDVSVHPILGVALLDLGYKRLHLVPASTLVAIPVWKKQRIYRHERARNMAKDKKKTLHLGLPGVIGLHEDLKGNLSILDGQHRVGMMSILEADGSTGVLDLTKILVEVYPQQNATDENHAKDLFLEINKAEPLKEIDLPDAVEDNEREIINKAAERLRLRFPEMFKVSQNCRPPHINLDNLRNNIFQHKVLSRHGDIRSVDTLTAWLLAQNAATGERYQKDELAQNSIPPKAWKKAVSNDFYLGLDSNWFYN